MLLHGRAFALSFPLVLLIGPAAADGGPLDLLHNGTFDTGSASWLIADGLDDASDAVVGWVAVASPGSTYRGALYFRATEESGAQYATQCVPVAANTVYAARADAQNLTTTTTVALGVAWYAAPNCASGYMGQETFDMNGGVADWFELAGAVSSPPAARSALVQLRTISGSPVTEARALFDNVRFGPSGAQDRGCEGPDCLDGQRGDRRFQVQITYDTVLGGGASGLATGVGLGAVGATSGLQFWFFDPTNPELLIKVLDGCAINGHYWVFYAAVTNVGFDVQVFDLATGSVWRRTNPDQTAAAPQQDVMAFPCAASS